MDWITAQLMRYIKKANYWNRLISLNNNTLIKQILFVKFNCDHNWSSDFKMLCNKVDMSQEFYTLLEINVDLFTTNLYNIVEGQWKNRYPMYAKIENIC